MRSADDRMPKNWELLEGVKREALNRFGWRSVRSCVGPRRLGVALSC